MTTPRLSFEFFPPKSGMAERRLWKIISQLERYAPDFISITCGAGGSTQEATFETVKRAASQTSLRPAAHLTCVRRSKADVDATARQYWAAGVSDIVALRGDPPGGIDADYTPSPEGYGYGADLVKGLMSLHDFNIYVAAYPERHPESENWDAELDNLKRKIDAGASAAITQFFLNSQHFLTFLERVRAAGINVPIIPGIMLQPNFERLSNMAKTCGVDVPDKLAANFAKLKEDAAGRTELTLELARGWMTDLQAAGVSQFHLYTLNSSKLASRLAAEKSEKPLKLAV